jgi:hypothetical protein
MSIFTGGCGRKAAAVAFAAAAAVAVSGYAGTARAETAMSGGISYQSPDGTVGLSVGFGDLLDVIAGDAVSDGGGGDTYYNRTTIINEAPRAVDNGPGERRRHHRRPGRGPGHGPAAGPGKVVGKPRPGIGGPGHGKPRPGIGGPGHGKPRPGHGKPGPGQGRRGDGWDPGHPGPDHRR